MSKRPSRMAPSFWDLSGRHQRKGPRRPRDDVPVRLRKTRTQGNPFNLLSVHYSINLYVYQSICLISLSAYQFLPFCLSVFLSVCLSVYQPFFLSAFLSISLSVYQPFCLSAFLSIGISIYSSFNSFGLFTLLPFSLSACLPINFRVGCSQNVRVRHFINSVSLK